MPSVASVAASVPVWARLPVVVTRARNRVPAVSIRSVSKAVKCRCNVVCLKRGFVSLTRNDTAQVRLSDLQNLPVDTIDLLALKQAGVVPAIALSAKVIMAGEIKRAVKLQGLLLTKGARAAVEAAGGSIAE